MEYNYQQTAPERCVKAMKKSGKLVVAVVGILAGALLMFVGNIVIYYLNNVIKDKSD